MVTTVADAAEVVDEEPDEDWLETLAEEETVDDLAESADESSALLDFEVAGLDSTMGNEAIKDPKSVPATSAFWEDA